jgi:dolichyldiphosphatase
MQGADGWEPDNMAAAICVCAVDGTPLACPLHQAIKTLVNQQRPAHARAADPGMPSSHATSLSFLATYAAAALSLQPNANVGQQAASVAVIATGSFLVRTLLTW